MEILAQNCVNILTLETLWCPLTSYRRQANVSRLINKRCQEWGNQSPSRPLRTMDYFIRRRIRGEGGGELWLWWRKYGSDGQAWTTGWERICTYILRSHLKTNLATTFLGGVVYPNGIYVFRQIHVWATYLNHIYTIYWCIVFISIVNVLVNVFVIFMLWVNR